MIDTAAPGTFRCPRPSCQSDDVMIEDTLVRGHVRLSCAACGRQSLPIPRARFERPRRVRRTRNPWTRGPAPWAK